jgi:ornithine cyclodeaminase/alanine dehydrogenase-like protein (mu-crystallin family)
MMLILTNEEVESILTMEDCIEVLEHAFAELGHGRAIATNRYDLSVPAKLPSAAYYRLKTMNGALPSLNTAAVRINSCCAPLKIWTGIIGQEG